MVDVPVTTPVVVPSSTTVLMTPTPTPAAPVVAPKVSIAVPAFLVAFVTFFSGLVSSGVTAVAGGAASLVTVKRVVIIGVVLGGLYGGHLLLKSERVSSITREFTQVSQELRGIGEKLDVTNEKLGEIEELTARFARVPVPEAKVDFTPAPVKHWFVKKPKASQ